MQRRVGSADEIAVTFVHPRPSCVYPTPFYAVPTILPCVGRRVRIRPGEGQRRYIPVGVYWHPCRESARVGCGGTHNAAGGAAIGPGRGLQRGFRISTRRPKMPLRIALYQPDIPQNTGTVLRLCACLGVEAHIIAPAGFPTSDRAFRRAGMDYLDAVDIVRHASWLEFEAWRTTRRETRSGHCRLVLFTTRATLSYLDYSFETDDILLFGRESAGVPDEVHDAADARLLIPLRPGLRSLNVAMAAAMAAGEALRQIRPAGP
jgi:tRNA (cytidine/uridine-2'-O-)-methyltransferase